MNKNNAAKNLPSLCEAAIFISLATVFALLKFPPFRIDLWANGGSIDFVMLPLFVMCFRLDKKWSIPACFIFGIVKFLITGDSISAYGGILAVLLDYVLAYGMVGVASFFRKMKGGFFIGIVVASLARFAVHFVSGITVWKIAVGDVYEILGMSFDSSLAVPYSLVYNGGYMLGELILCLVLGAMIYMPIKKLPPVGKRSK